MRRLAYAAFALLACTDVGAEEASLPDEPDQLVKKLEARLVAARHVAIEASLQAEGLVNGKLSGRGEWQDRNRASAAWRGELGGKAAELKLSSDGRVLELRGSEQLHREAPGKESNRADLVGFVRMGLVHNLLRLSSAQAPEHGSGGIEDWVVLDAFRPMTYAQDGELQGAMSFGYDLLVADQVVGSVRLWLDPASGLPRRRLVIINAPQGESRVTEDYTRFVVE